MSAAFSASGVTVCYGRAVAVQEASIVIPEGAVVSIIGANGAGKTSLLLALMGLLPCSGAVELGGDPITRLTTEERVERGLALVSERRDLYGSLSVEDNLMLGSFRRGRAGRRQSIERVFALFPRLKERRRQTAATLSGGERQMLAMGRALMSDPRVLLLDEPSLGLAPLIVRELFRIIDDLGRSGTSILLIEQNARAALQVSRTAYLMELGNIVRHAPAAQLLADPDLSATYFGTISQ